MGAGCWTWLCPPSFRRAPQGRSSCLHPAAHGTLQSPQLTSSSAGARGALCFLLPGEFLPPASRVLPVFPRGTVAYTSTSIPCTSCREHQGWRQPQVPSCSPISPSSSARAQVEAVHISGPGSVSFSPREVCGLFYKQECLGGKSFLWVGVGDTWPCAGWSGTEGWGQCPARCTEPPDTSCASHRLLQSQNGPLSASSPCNRAFQNRT